MTLEFVWPTVGAQWQVLVNTVKALRARWMGKFFTKWTTVSFLRAVLHGVTNSIATFFFSFLYSTVFPSTWFVKMERKWVLWTEGFCVKDICCKDFGRWGGCIIIETIVITLLFRFRNNNNNSENGIIIIIIIVIVFYHNFIPTVSKDKSLSPLLFLCVHIRPAVGWSGQPKHVVLLNKSNVQHLYSFVRRIIKTSIWKIFDYRLTLGISAF